MPISDNKANTYEARISEISSSMVATSPLNVTSLNLVVKGIDLESLRLGSGVKQV